MSGRAFCCILGVMVLAYLDHTVPGIPPPQCLVREGYSRYRTTWIASRTLALKPDTMTQDSLPKKHKQRDLGAYDKAGPYSLKPSLDARARDANEKGDWRVAVEVNRLLVTRGESKRKHSQTDNFEVNAVQRIEVLGHGMITSIPEDVRREPQSFKLRLIDDRGNVRFEI